MAYPTISTLPTPPSRQDPANFATEADAFLGALPTFQSQVNTAGDFIETKAGEALTSANSAASSAAAASLQATAWVSGASYTAGAVVWTSSDYASYRAKITHSGITTNPSLDPTRWKNLTGIQASLDVNSENRIINGDFGVWQRGTSSTASGYVAADRWSNGATGGTVTQSRLDFPLGFSDFLNSTSFYLRQTVSGQTLASHNALTQQKIENVRSYAGQTITVLGWARRGSGTGNMAVEAAQNFGTGGSPSASVTAISPTTVSLAPTSFAPFAAVMNVPSIAGKTLGSNGNDNLTINFWTSAGSDFNARTNSLGLQTIGVDLWGIHIRTGTWTATDATLYRPRDLGTELALCQRYYAKLGGEVIGDILLQGTGSTGSAISGMYTLPVIMRDTPQATKVGTWTVFNCTQPTIVSSTRTLIGINCAGTSGTLGQIQTSTTLTAFLTADAEL